MISIKDFHKGQSSSPYLTDGAFSKSQNLDVFSQKGIARINYLPTGYSTNLDGLPIQFATNSNNTTTLYFAADDESVYSITTSGTITKIGSGKGNNVEYFQLSDVGYLWAIYRNTLNKFTFGGSWADTGKTITSLGVKDNHFFFNSRQDGKLYVAGTYSSGFGIGRLTSAESWTQMAFTLPKGFKPISITELDRYLIISAKKAAGSTEKEVPETTYFFWDRVDGAIFDRMITVPEKGMHTFIQRGDTIYITGGNRGNIYRLTESGFQFYAQIPFDYDNKSVKIGNVSDTDGTNSFQAGVWFNNRLILGITSEDTLSPAGIYGVRDRGISHEFNPSNGDDASTNDIYIGGMSVFSDDKLYYGWKKVASGPTTTYGVDVVSMSNDRVGSYGSYLESIFYPVATRGSKKSFDKVEVQLARPLQTGEGVRIRYRRDLNQGWDSTTILGTQTFATNGAVSSLEFPGIHNLENIQIRVELTTGATANTPYILSIRLLP